MKSILILLAGIICFLPDTFGAVSTKPLRVIAEVNIGESKDIILSNGETVKLKLLKVNESRDELRNALRGADVTVSVDNKEVILGVGNYNLPVIIGKVQIDCSALDSHFQNSAKNKVPIAGKAIFRLWPKDSPFMKPGTFVFPIKQDWLASVTQSGNEPTYVDWGENPEAKTVYYHSGLDFGGAEGMDEIVAATDGLIVSVNKERLQGHEDLPGDSRKDVVYVVNDLGWYFRYSHLDSTDPAIKLGSRVKMGQKIGMIGKQGHSGGWVHLHFEISSKEGATGKWITEDAYPYAWEAFVRQYKPALIAVARPHHLVWAGKEVILDGSKSRSMKGNIVSYEWILSDGNKAKGALQKKIYKEPGEYSEILKISDAKGNIDYDFTVVQVLDPKNPASVIPVLHAAFHPSLNIKAGDPITFLVRTFNTMVGTEEWDFGDGSPIVKVKSEAPDKKDPTKGEFAKTKHSFSKAGHYIVKVQRSNESGYKATANLHVVVN